MNLFGRAWRDVLQDLERQRKPPRMPAFKEEISRNDVWRVIHFIKTFRK
jgi:hypothetical protein